eukprot:1133506-Pelagomonas_calceolata.AAC.1
MEYRSGLSTTSQLMCRAGKEPVGAARVPKSLPLLRLKPPNSWSKKGSVIKESAIVPVGPPESMKVLAEECLQLSHCVLASKIYLSTLVHIGALNMHPCSRRGRLETRRYSFQ